MMMMMTPMVSGNGSFCLSFPLTRSQDHALTQTQRSKPETKTVKREKSAAAMCHGVIILIIYVQCTAFAYKYVTTNLKTTQLQPVTESQLHTHKHTQSEKRSRTLNEHTHIFIKTHTRAHAHSAFTSFTFNIALNLCEIIMRCERAFCFRCSLKSGACRLLLLLLILTLVVLILMLKSNFESVCYKNLTKYTKYKIKPTKQKRERHTERVRVRKKRKHTKWDTHRHLLNERYNEKCVRSIWLLIQVRIKRSEREQAHCIK